MSVVRVGGTAAISDGSVTNVKVAANAAINADKLADGTTNKILTAAERTKLAGVAAAATAYDNEQAQDAAATLFTGGTHTGISFSYDDANNKINGIVTGGGGGGAAGQTYLASGDDSNLSTALGSVPGGMVLVAVRVAGT